MRKVVSVLLSAAMALSLCAGCSSSSSDTEKSNLWCWNVLQYSESQDTWYSIGSGIEVNWDIAARKAKEIIKM